MILTKLEVFGFKSFAHKAVFKFDQGLTGVIGPNGCGKSNIVDAIRWVLGEQRPSILRCDRMDNLIFNGTATRKPLSLAEVSMFIENNRNVLPSEYTELKITRRLHRSGESEYLINNEAVRLMDIINLFADTGMGADAYSVIELKMVEQILSDNAQERRRLFEEAAGIKKYKARRKSALNKLDATQQELTRLEDILAEVQKAVNALARQVGKARRYHEYKAEMRDKELLLSHLRIHSYQNQIKPIEMESAQVRNTRDALNNETRTLEAQLEQQQTEAIQKEQLLRQKSAILHQKDEIIQEQQNRRQLHQQKIGSLEEAIGAYHQEIAAQHEKIKQLGAEQTGLDEQVEQIRKEMAEAQEHYRTSANRQLEAETAYQEAREAYQEFVQRNLQELQQSGEVKEAYQKIQIEKDNLSTRIVKSEGTLEKIEADLRERGKSLAELERTLEGLKEDQEMYQQETAHLEKTLQTLRERRETLRSEINQTEGQLEKSRNRRDFLENLINNYEGFSHSVQYIMSRKQEYAGVVDTLANLVDCEETYRPALESYLSEISNYLIVEAVDTAQHILKHLRSNDKGRLTLVPLPLLNENRHDGIQLPSPNGKITPLKQVVNYPEAYERLFNFLFHSVYVVPDLDSAIELRANYPQVTYVTLEGEILEHWGNLTGGSASRQVGLIGRKEQYQKTLDKLAALEENLGKQKQALAEAHEKIDTSEIKLREFAELQKSLQTQLVDVEKQLSRQNYEVKRLEETATEVREEVTDWQRQLAELEAREKALFPQIQQLEERVQDYKAKEAVVMEKQRQAEARLKELTRETQSQQITYLNLTSREKELVQKSQFLVQSIREAERFIEDREQRIVENQGQVEALGKEVSEISTRLEALYRERDAAEKERNTIDQQYQEVRNAIQVCEGDLKKKQRLWNQARERLQELELHIKEIQVKLATQQEQVTEKYGAEALAFDIEQLDPSISILEVQKSIEDLKDKLEKLGDVNPLAIKEHEKEKERLDFLNGQRDDLLSARDQLVETIQKLNTTARKQFLEVYEKIQKNFQRVFKEFFDGGSAEMMLLESKDPLEANIDISVTHKGKKLNTLSLLSAGEKTLTAISLLFAIYLVKPSPFCILDEVDAPLDDVNIVRLTHALRQFSRETQFILVTHNKKTMEAASALYGVTMEELGVSKVVSVRFD